MTFMGYEKAVTFILILMLMCTSEQHTYNSSEHFQLEEEFSCPG